MVGGIALTTGLVGSVELGLGLQFELNAGLAGSITVGMLNVWPKMPTTRTSYPLRYHPLRPVAPRRVSFVNQPTMSRRTCERDGAGAKQRNVKRQWNHKTNAARGRGAERMTA